MLVAQTILVALLAYAACGLAFAVAFVTVGAARLDPAARGTSIAFRLLLLPGAAALWPLLAVRWPRGSRPGEHS